MDTSTNKKIALFVECFGDSADTAAELFSCRDVITVCKYEEDRLAAMASLVPILADNSTKGFYLYGVCVAEDFRGRGLFRLIMQKAEGEARDRGASFVCLIPADKELADTYRRFSYDTEVAARGESAEKRIELSSYDFRRFAKVGGRYTDKRMSGLLKSFDVNIFCPHDREYGFSDDMGDV